MAAACVVVANPEKLPDPIGRDRQKSDGNVRLSELALAARATPSGNEIIEISTFDGRTSLNLAINAPPGASIAICRPISHPHLRSRRPSSDTSTSQRPARGCATAAACGESMPIRSCSCAATPRPSIGRRILAERAFVDCSHAYDYARTASESAMRLVKTGGIVLWHDYGVWPSVTQALDELEAERPLAWSISAAAAWCSGAPDNADFRRAAPAGQDTEDPLHLAAVETPASAEPAYIASRGR